MPPMVAKAAWLTVEPELSLAAYLESEEVSLAPAPLNWLPGDWSICTVEQSQTCPADETE